MRKQKLKNVTVRDHKLIKHDPMAYVDKILYKSLSQTNFLIKIMNYLVVEQLYKQKAKDY
jgi:hypothetical protein